MLPRVYAPIPLGSITFFFGMMFLILCGIDYLITLSKKVKQITDTCIFISWLVISRLGVSKQVATKVLD